MNSARNSHPYFWKCCLLAGSLLVVSGFCGCVTVPPPELTTEERAYNEQLKNQGSSQETQSEWDDFSVGQKVGAYVLGALMYGAYGFAQSGYSFKP